jgi:release factor glutamine methyltransferase
MSVLNATTIIDAINLATLQLEGGFVISPRSEAEMIVSEKTAFSKTELYLYPNRELERSEKDAIAEMIKERLTGRPLQYILGHQQFRYLDIVCREEVLIPRPETELLVDAVLDELKRKHDNNEPPLVLDMGCGTGAIGLSVAHEYPEAIVYMVDKSETAMALTIENMQRHKLQAQVKVIRSDLFAETGFLKGNIDIIVSNPPYIRSGEMASLQREVKFEPCMALDGGADGLDYYKAIAGNAREYLKKGGMLLFEVGYDQSSEVKGIIEATNFFTETSSFYDYQGIERIVSARSG